VSPDAGYTAKRRCRFCKADTQMHITVEQWRILVSCRECNASYELERFQ